MIDGLPTLAPLLADRGDPRRPGALRLARLAERLQSAAMTGGHGERTRCEGTESERRTLTWRFDLEQLERTSTLDGRTLLTAFESRHTIVTDVRDDRRVDGTLNAETIDLPDVGDWRVTEDMISLRAQRRFRRAGAATASCAATRPFATVAPMPGADDLPVPRCSHITEIATSVRRVNRSIELEQVVYIDGYLSERVVWALDS